MAKYITRTIIEYNTVVTYCNGMEVHKFELKGEKGKKEAKKEICEIIGNDNIVVVSIERKEVKETKYRMKEEDFILNAEKLEYLEKENDSLDM